MSSVDILTVNNTCDVEGDAKAGRRTLSILLGPRGSAWLIEGLAAGALALALSLVPLRVLPVAALGTLTPAALFGARELRRMRARGYSHRTKAAAMGGISVIFVAYSLAVLAALSIDAALR
jgi:1,4-dihydroxy-2-naphthoate octaprenyltransferase